MSATQTERSLLRTRPTVSPTVPSSRTRIIRETSSLSPTNQGEGSYTETRRTETISILPPIPPIIVPFFSTKFTTTKSNSSFLLIILPGIRNLHWAPWLKGGADISRMMKITTGVLRAANLKSFILSVNETCAYLTLTITKPDSLDVHEWQSSYTFDVVLTPDMFSESSLALPTALEMTIARDGDDLAAIMKLVTENMAPPTRLLKRGVLDVATVGALLSVLECPLSELPELDWSQHPLGFDGDEMIALFASALFCNGVVVVGIPLIGVLAERLFRKKLSIRENLRKRTPQIGSKAIGLLFPVILMCGGVLVFHANGNVSIVGIVVTMGCILVYMATTAHALRTTRIQYKPEENTHKQTSSWRERVSAWLSTDGGSWVPVSIERRDDVYLAWTGMLYDTLRPEAKWFSVLEAVTCVVLIITPILPVDTAGECLRNTIIITATIVTQLVAMVYLKPYHTPRIFVTNVGNGLTQFFTCFFVLTESATSRKGTKVLFLVLAYTSCLINFALAVLAYLVTLVEHYETIKKRFHKATKEKRNVNLNHDVNVELVLLEEDEEKPLRSPTELKILWESSLPITTPPPPPPPQRKLRAQTTRVLPS
eukprot:PhF_6_TR26331/c0_g1_i1/m.37865